MKKRILSLAILVLSACQTSDNTEEIALPQGITFIEEVKAQADKTLIPYKKYQLDNGLTLILHEDHSDPLVHVDVTYHVGSAREDIGKSGFAHFFEHMMFQGSEHVSDEQHFKIVTEAGGSMNGTTNTDRTNYYQTVPANQLEKILWLESDRMGFLLPAVTQEKFEVQRETVKNERGQRVDNRPYGRLNERVSQALYPEGHPYSWPVIGYMDDLNRVDVNDLKAFFLRWYGPNNATLTIGGDIDVAETLALANKYFATIPQGPEVDMPEKPVVTLENDRYISMEDNVHLPLLYMAYPTVYVRHEDEAPLDLLAEILGGGKTSLLYKNLVKNQIAVQAQVSHPCAELACTFNLLALPNPRAGKSLADVEKVIRDSLVEFEQRGVEDDDLIKAKAQMKSGTIFGLQSVAGKVSQLAANETFSGNPNYIEKDIARYANVTKADVLRVYEQYIKNKSAVIMSIVPNGQPQMVAAPDNFTPPERVIPAQKHIKSTDLNIRSVVDDFDRSIMPVAKTNKPVDVPVMWEKSFDNGINILGTQSLETPTTSLLIKIPAGHYFEDKAQAGTASLMASLLNESTTVNSSEAMSKALQMLGSSVSISANNADLVINVNTLTENLDATLALVLEKITQPAFKQAEFDRVKNNALQSIIHNKKDASYLSSRAYRQLLEADNIASMPVGGTVASLTTIALADIKAFYQAHVKPLNSEVIVVSNLAQQELTNHLALFKPWQGKGEPLEITLPAGNAKAGVIYLVHKDNSPQSAIRIGKRTLTKDFTGEFFKASLMNYPLGGAFNSRINLNLREDKGYTYGARSSFWADKYSGSYTASAQVRANVTDKSLTEFIKEISGYYQDGITDEELIFMRNAITQGDALKYETPRAKLGFLAQIQAYNLDSSFVAKQSEIIASISKAEINALAKKYLNVDEMVIVVVGDAPVLTPQLKALGYEVIPYEL